MKRKVKFSKRHVLHHSPRPDPGRNFGNSCYFLSVVLNDFMTLAIELTLLQRLLVTCVSLKSFYLLELLLDIKHSFILLRF